MTIGLQNVTATEALDAILAPLNLKYTIEDQVVRVERQIDQSGAQGAATPAGETAMTKLLLGLLISISSIPSIPQQRDPGRLMIGGVRTPEVLSETKPYYSAQGLQRRVEGTVLLEGFVRTDGRFQLLRVARGLGFGLDEMAAIAARSWRFRPGTKDGVAVDMVHTVAVLFKLPPAKPKFTPPNLLPWLRQFAEGANLAGFDGEHIEAKITIIATGAVTNVQVLNDINVELKESFVSALKKAKLTPATQGGVPRATRSKVSYQILQ